MRTLDQLALAVLGVIVAVGLPLVGVVSADRRRRLGRDYAAARSIGLDPDASALAGRLVLAFRRGRYLGAVAVLVAGYLVVIRPADLVNPGFGYMATLIAIHVGSSLVGTAAAAVAVRRAGRALPGDVRVAHLRAPRLGDFLPPLLRWGPAATLGASTVAVVAFLVTAPHPAPPSRAALVAAWAVSLAGVLAAEALAQVVIRAPRVATSQASLAVRDEITGDLAAVVTAGAFGPSLVCALVAAIAVPGAAGIGALLVVIPALLETRRRQHVRDRLWTAPSARLAPRDAAP